VRGTPTWVLPSDHRRPNDALYFHYAFFFGLTTIILAYILDSLVRVSRRDDKWRPISVFAESFVETGTWLLAAVTLTLVGYTVPARRHAHRTITQALLHSAQICLDSSVSQTPSAPTSRNGHVLTFKSLRKPSLRDRRLLAPTTPTLMGSGHDNQGV